jgi:hypothetical protein
MKYCENCHDMEKCEMYGGCWNPPAKEKPLSPSDATACSAAYSDHLIAALRCLDDEGLRLLTVELAKRIGGKAGNRGMCLRHHEWDRTTISGMTCSYCKETTDTAHFIYEPNAKVEARGK